MFRRVRHEGFRPANPFARETNLGRPNESTLTPDLLLKHNAAIQHSANPNLAICHERFRLTVSKLCASVNGSLAEVGSNRRQTGQNRGSGMPAWFTRRAGSALSAGNDHAMPSRGHFKRIDLLNLAGLQDHASDVEAEKLRDANRNKLGGVVFPRQPLEGLC